MKTKDKKTSEKNSGRALPVVIMSVAVDAIVFIALIFLIGYIFYSKEINTDRLWIVYLISAAVSNFISCIIASKGLKLKGVIVGLIYALGNILVHSIIITSLNAGSTGMHTVLILLSVIISDMAAGIIGANIFKH